jgi:hypothetical protein
LLLHDATHIGYGVSVILMVVMFYFKNGMTKFMVDDVFQVLFFGARVFFWWVSNVV